jgi:two-component system OmpR family sensor kinase
MSERPSPMRRIPIRVRLALSFALVMAAVVAATGAFVSSTVAHDVDGTIDREASGRLARIVAIVRDDGDDLGKPGDDPLAKFAEQGLVQVLDDAGRVADTTIPALARAPVLGPQQLDAVIGSADGTVDASVPLLGERFRLAVAPARSNGAEYTVIAGASLAQRDETLADLRKRLLIGGPIALLLASLAAYGVASAALRPVDHMRRRAAAISAGERGQRLPVPPARDEIADLGVTLNAMLARIERAFERERAFSAVASHELRTPLAILKTELELASKRGRTREELEAAIDSAADETERLVRLAEDLLLVARADQGRLPLKPEPVQIAALAQRVTRLFAHRAEADDRSLMIAVRERGLTITADPARMEQALANMVDNALRHGDGRVSIDAQRRDGRVELHVIDEGSGFPEEVADNAFERLTSSPRAGSHGGTGLGLAIVAAIAHAHDGTAQAVNQASGGADVWLSIPGTDH